MPPKRTAPRKTGAHKKRRIAVPEEPQTPASKLDETSDGNGFQSQIFTILVGLQEQKYTAHASFLSRSPVLDRMCHGEFEESRTFTIRLPDDKPKVIKAMIQYLYSGDFRDPSSAEPYRKTAYDLAEIYGSAEKYQLQGLKALIIKKLGSVVDVVKRPIEFMSTAKVIYDCIPNSDMDFRAFFKNSASKSLLPTIKAKAIRQEFDAQLADGGTMAVDMVAAILSDYNVQIRSSYFASSGFQTTIARLQSDNEQLKKDNEQLKKDNEELKEDNEQLEEDYEQLKECKERYKEDYKQLKKSLRNTNGFDSPIFTIITGPEEKVYTAHATYLSQSPVFEKICHGRFQESLMFEIKLPEDDPEVIRALIQYLYTGNFHDFGTIWSAHSPKGAGSQLARLYVTAEKYQLQVLKELVLSKFGSVLDPRERPLEFLYMAESMYENTPDTDTTWRDFFKSFAARLQKPNRMSKSIRDIFDNFVYGGGAQAVDMVEAICTDYQSPLPRLQRKE
ncbi:MAG: hypothetical protein Q9171_004313 [Xanthocarpia ochracea]